MTTPQEIYERNTTGDKSSKVVMCTECKEIITQQTVDKHYEDSNDIQHDINIKYPYNVATKKKVKDKDEYIYKWVPAARTQIYADRLSKYATENSKYIDTIHIGDDNNHKKKSGKPTERGNQTCAARQCSAHIRAIYPQRILQENEETEFCVNSRNHECENNECKLCHIEDDKQKWKMSDIIYIAQGIGGDAANMLYHLGTNYPTNKKYSLLRVKKNGIVIIKYYIKLIPTSSMMKTASPSGYKYKDRMSVSKFSKIQSNRDQDIILCIDGAIHGVGFWNLLENGGNRYLLQLNEEQSVNARLYCLIDGDSEEIGAIDVELVVNRNKMENKVISLWSYCQQQNLNNYDNNNNQNQYQSQLNFNHNNNNNYNMNNNVGNNSMGQQQQNVHNNNNVVFVPNNFNYNGPPQKQPRFDNLSMNMNHLNNIQPFPRYQYSSFNSIINESLSNHDMSTDNQHYHQTTNIPFRHTFNTNHDNLRSTDSQHPSFNANMNIPPIPHDQSPSFIPNTNTNTNTASVNDTINTDQYRLESNSDVLFDNTMNINDDTQSCNQRNQFPFIEDVQSNYYDPHFYMNTTPIPVNNAHRSFQNSNQFNDSEHRIHRRTLEALETDKKKALKLRNDAHIKEMRNNIKYDARSSGYDPLHHQHQKQQQFDVEQTQLPSVASTEFNDDNGFCHYNEGLYYNE